MTEPVSLERAYLIFARITFRDSANRTPESERRVDWPSEMHRTRERSVFLCSTNPLHYKLRTQYDILDWNQAVATSTTHRTTQREDELDNEYWITMIRTLTGSLPDTMDEYRSHLLTFELDPAKMMEVLNGGEEEHKRFNRQRKALFHSLPKTIVGEPLDHDAYLCAPSILVLQLDSKTITYALESDSSMNVVTAGLTQLFKLPPAWLPTPLDMALLFPGMSYSGFSNEATIVSLIRAEANAKSFVNIPHVAINIIEIMQSERILSHIVQRMEACPLHHSRIDEYLAEIQHSKSRLREARDLLSNVRALSFRILRSGDEVTSCLEAEMAQTLWKQLEAVPIDHLALFSVGEPAMKSKWVDYRPSISRMIHSRIKGVRTEGQNLRLNQDWAVVYLTDQINIDVGLSNIELQKVMLFVAFLAFFATIASLLTSFVMILGDKEIMFWIMGLL